MKKIFCLLFAAFAALHTAFGQMVSESEARSFCAGFLQKNTQLIALTASSMETVSTARLKNGAPAYFVMQPSDGEGFVVLAANRAAKPILGYSSTDSFDPQNLPPGLQYLLDNYKMQLEQIAKLHIKPTAEIEQSWKSLTQPGQAEELNGVTVGPLLHTRWDQRPLYNKKCPGGAPTGCVATTMAQLMAYWRFPITNQTVWVVDEDDNSDNGISGNFGAYVGGGYNWDNMPEALGTTSTTSQIDEIANLMNDCGVAAEMDYGTNDSGSNIGKAADALHKYFGYEQPTIVPRSLYTDADWIALLKTNLNAGYPMHYRGESGAGAHAWVCDGYHDDYFHMNWGWGWNTQLNNNSYWELADLHGYGGNGYNSGNAIYAPKPQGCTPFAVLSGVQTNFNVEVAHWISASSTLPPLPGITIVFNAHDDIALTDGFTAAQGTDFYAFIQGCNGFAGDPGSDDRSAEPETIEAAIPAGTVQIAPNPFSGSTTIRYALSSEQQVAMHLLDATGKLVATPMQAETQSQGEHQFNLEAGNLPSGLYFLLLQMGDKQETKRVILSR